MIKLHFPDTPQGKFICVGCNFFVRAEVKKIALNQVGAVGQDPGPSRSRRNVVVQGSSESIGPSRRVKKPVKPSKMSFSNTAVGNLDGFHSNQGGDRGEICQEGQKEAEIKLNVHQEFLKTLDLGEQFRAFKTARAGKIKQPFKVGSSYNYDDDGDIEMSANQSTAVQVNNDGQQLPKFMDESSKKRKSM